MVAFAGWFTILSTEYYIGEGTEERRDWQISQMRFRTRRIKNRFLDPIHVGC